MTKQKPRPCKPKPKIWADSIYADPDFLARQRAKNKALSEIMHCMAGISKPKGE